MLMRRSSSALVAGPVTALRRPRALSGPSEGPTVEGAPPGASEDSSPGPHWPHVGCGHYACSAHYRRVAYYPL